MAARQYRVQGADTETTLNKQYNDVNISANARLESAAATELAQAFPSASQSSQAVAEVVPVDPKKAEAQQQAADAKAERERKKAEEKRLAEEKKKQVEEEKERFKASTLGQCQRMQAKMLQESGGCHATLTEIESSSVAQEVKNEQKQEFEQIITELSELANKMKHVATNDDAAALLARAPILIDEVKKAKSKWKKVQSALSSK